MKILALETSGTSGSVALWEGPAGPDPLEWNLPEGSRSARSLAPTIQIALAEFGWKPTEIELVAVTSGPGSFTGIRVGVVTAKSFAYSTGCQVVGVNTLQVIAANGVLESKDGRVTAVMDAQRSELFVAKYRWDLLQHPTPWSCEQATMVISADQWLSDLKPDEFVVGPALEKLANKIPSHVRMINSKQWQPQAAAVASVGFYEFESSADETHNPLALMPQYFRRTAAEEQWDKRHGL